MKEIVEKLHEQRQVELAKEILESEGYEVKLSESEDDVESSEDSRREAMRAKVYGNPTYKKIDALCKKYGYQLDRGYIDEGSIWIGFYPKGRFSPDIYYEDRRYLRKEPEFRIGTTSYGSLNIEEYSKFLEGCNNAYALVTEINKLDLNTLTDITDM